MIGVFITTNENGQRIWVRYSRIDGIVKILSVSGNGGSDVVLSRKYAEKIKEDIKQLSK
jgi:hypothetical protein